MFVDLLMNGELNKHCNAIRQECIAMEQQLMKQMAINEGLNSELQSKSWLEYAQGMNNLQQRVTEIVMSELVYN
ncbi:MAG: TnpV protein [Clostridia bacterium]|nr:TnpV protein [Clostridia bacterium]